MAQTQLRAGTLNAGLQRLAGASRPAFRPAASRVGCRRAAAASSRPRAAAEPQQQQQPPAPPRAPLPAASDYITDADFSVSKVSFGAILTPLGLGLLFYGFGAYAQLLPGSDISSLLLIYGFPISILGFALSYAQLEPVPCKTSKAAYEMRATQMTDIQKQIREDCTRFRYGDEQHLEEALERIFKSGKAGGVARKFTPKLIGLREESEEGRYALVLEFESGLDYEKWEERVPKIQSFFGPGIEARLGQTEKGMDVLLVCDGSGAGRGGGDKKDVLPPLMPGLKPRQQ